ncbi:uncharacterized protein ACNLHF_016640 [Anomaloglossus baeobatrachus]
MASSADLRDELLCSICSSIFKDPVMLRCGHNFCRVCIDCVLDTQDESGVYSCPECREDFHERPALMRNINLHNVAEQFVVIKQEEAEITGICCTYCVDSPVPAARTCLHCEASLCEKHLRAHSKSPEHVLCDPSTSLEKRKCSVHKKILEYYCTEDGVCICVSCRLAGEHWGHEVETLHEASEKMKMKLRNVLQKLTTKREETEDRVQSLEEQRSKAQEKAAEEAERVTALCTDIRRRVDDLEKKVLSEISRQEKESLPSLIHQLEIKKDELSWKMRHIEELCNMTDPLTVLQEPDTGDLCDPKEEEGDKDTGGHDKQLHDECDLDVAVISHTLQTLREVITVIRTGIFVEDPADILLDVKTAGNHVTISDDLKTATWTQKKQRCQETTKRFQCNQVISRVGFTSGQHDWEVESRRFGNWRVGMCYPSIDRSGDQSHIGNNNKSWGLLRCNDQYSVIDNRKEIRLPHRVSNDRIRICLDYEAGQLSFFELCDPIRHLYTFTAAFSEPLHVALCVNNIIAGANIEASLLRIYRDQGEDPEIQPQASPPGRGLQATSSPTDYRQSIALAAAGEPLNEHTMKQLMSEIMSTFKKDMQNMLRSMQRDINAVEERTTHIEDKMAELTTAHNDVVDSVVSIDEEVDALKLKVADMEDRSRRNNVRLRGIAEMVKTEDLKEFLTDYFSYLLPDTTQLDLIMDRAHRLPKPKHLPAAIPRDVIWQYFPVGSTGMVKGGEKQFEQAMDVSASDLDEYEIACLTPCSAGPHMGRGTKHAQQVPKNNLMRSNAGCGCPLNSDETSSSDTSFKVNESDFYMAKEGRNAIQSALKGLKDDVAQKGARLDELECRVSRVEDDAEQRCSDVELLEKNVYILLDRLEDLENRSRRNNLRLVGLPETMQHTILGGREGGHERSSNGASLGIKKQVKEKFDNASNRLCDTYSSFLRDPCNQQREDWKQAKRQFDLWLEKRELMRKSQLDIDLRRFGDRTGKLLANLARGKRHRNNIQKIKKDGSVVTKPVEIKSSGREGGTNFLEKVNIPTLTTAQLDLLNGNVTEQEAQAVIKYLPADKSPGPDGYTGDFYKAMTQQITPTLTRWLNKLLQGNTLLEWSNLAYINLIPKEGKDRKDTVSFRPISLINQDIKIILKLMANRLVEVLLTIITPAQVGFIKGRSAVTNIRRTLLAIDAVGKDVNGGGRPALVTLDAEKAFDNVKWRWMDQVLDKVELKGTIRNYIRMIYTEPMARIQIPGHLSNAFSLQKGTRQGFPLSPLLFDLALEPLARYVEQHKCFDGVTLGHKSLKAAYFADDIILYMGDVERDLPKVLGIFEEFGEFLEFTLNKTKCEILYLRTRDRQSCGGDNLNEIPIANMSIKYLGIRLGRRIDLFPFFFLPSAMASAALRDELLCSICSSIFKEPVMLRCGHNFCWVCIDRVLDTQHESGVYSCPECREEFHERPALMRNINLHNVAEQFVVIKQEQEEITGICCTYCVDSPVPAVRSCLHCEASLCDKHLRAHSKSPEHVLCDPSTSLEERKCSVHKKILEYYCTEDAACICVSCRLAGEHWGHEVETLHEASEKKKMKLRNVLQKLTTKREETEERYRSLEEQRSKAQEKAAEEAKRVTALCTDIRRRVDDLEMKVLSLISRQEKESLSSLIHQLEIKKNKLSWNMRHIEELCNMTDPLTILQEPDTGDLCDPKEEKGDKDTEGHDKQLHDEYCRDVAKISLTLQTLREVITVIRTGIYVQDPADILLDVNTAGNYITISDDLKTATWTHKNQHRQETTERFQCNQVISRMGFTSGRHYWDVESRKLGNWKVGMCYPSIDRSGHQSHIGNNNKSWSLLRCNDQYSVIDNRQEIRLPHNVSSDRIRICLDYEAGQLSFFELCDPIRHLYTFTAAFSEPLHVALCVNNVVAGANIEASLLRICS